MAIEADNSKITVKNSRLAWTLDVDRVALTSDSVEAYSIDAKGIRVRAQSAKQEHTLVQPFHLGVGISLKGKSTGDSIDIDVSAILVDLDASIIKEISNLAVFLSEENKEEVTGKALKNG